MSATRCGLQVSRDTTITNSIHDWPRSKQLGCLLQGTIVDSGESHLSEDVVDDQLEDILEAKRDKAEADMNPDMSGSGIFSASKKLLSKLVSVPRRAVERVAADVSNIFPDSDENARPIFPGEHHQLFKLPNKKFGRANYSGPGTRIIKRLKRGDPPRVPVDQVAQAHDIRYGLAEGGDDVRKADQKMLRSLERLKREKTDSKFNIDPAMLGIRGKVAAEDFGMLSREAFISKDFRPSGGDRNIMKSKLDQLEQKGFGSDGNFVSKSTGRPRNVRRFVNTNTFNPGPGTSKTQSLAFKSPMSTQYMKGVPSVDRRQNRTVASQIASRGVNTRGMFRDGTSGVTQSGDGQNPGAAAPASSSYINVKTAGRNSASQNIQAGGQGFGSSSYGRIGAAGSHQFVDVQTGAGLRPSPAGAWPARDTDRPGGQLLKKMQGQVKKGKSRDYHGLLGHGVGKKRRKKPLYWDEHRGYDNASRREMAGMLANKMLPMIMVH